MSLPVLGNKSAGLTCKYLIFSHSDSVHLTGIDTLLPSNVKNMWIAFFDAIKFILKVASQKILAKPLTALNVEEMRRKRRCQEWGGW